MPIVVAVLGVVIIVMGILLFTLSPAEETPVVQTEEMNRTESMEVEEEVTRGGSSLAQVSQERPLRGRQRAQEDQRPERG